MNSSTSNSKQISNWSKKTLVQVIVLAISFLLSTLYGPWLFSGMVGRILSKSYDNMPEVNALSDKTEVAFFGASHFYYAIYPHLFERNVMVISAPGIEFARLEPAIHSTLKRAPNLRLAYIEFDSVMFIRDYIELFDTYSTMWAIDVKPWEVPMALEKRIPVTLDWIRWALGFHQSRAAWDDLKYATGELLKTGKYTPKPQHINYRPVDMTMNQANDGKSRIGAHLRQNRRVDIDLTQHEQALYRMIEVFYKQKIPVVLLQSPHHQTYWDHWPKSFQKRWYTILREVKKRWPKQSEVRFRNLATLPFLTDEDFRDGNHLNGSGGHKFSRHLNELTETYLAELGSKQNSNQL